MDIGLFTVLQAQLEFGTLRHKSALQPYFSVQTVEDFTALNENIAFENMMQACSCARERMLIFQWCAFSREEGACVAAWQQYRSCEVDGQ